MYNMLAELSRFLDWEMAETRYSSYISALDQETTALPLAKESLLPID